MQDGQLYSRTKQLAIDIIAFAGKCNRSLVNDILLKQLVRSGTSVGANYRSAFRGRSTAECIAKLGIVEEEADETLYWLDLVAAADSSVKAQTELLYREVNEILAMVVASKVTLRKNKK